MKLITEFEELEDWTSCARNTFGVYFSLKSQLKPHDVVHFAVSSKA